MFGANRAVTCLAVVAALLPSFTATWAAVGDEAYQLPLLDAYAIHRGGGKSIFQEDGRYQLVLVDFGNIAFSSITVLPQVETIAVVDKVITGKTQTGYFLLDTRRAPSPPRLIQTIEQWRSALADEGVLGDIQLADPDSIAAGLPERTIRPWKFQMARGALGFSDDGWSVIVQLAGMAIALILGFLMRRDRALLPIVFAIGVATNILAQIVLAGGGPGAFLGFLGLPLFCWLAAYFGRMIRALFIPTARTQLHSG